MFDRSKKKKVKMKSDFSNYRLKRFLYEMDIKGMELPRHGVKAVICADGVLIFDTCERGWVKISMINEFEQMDFNLNLNVEEMEDFNGGEGVKQRAYPWEGNK